MTPTQQYLTYTEVAGWFNVGVPIVRRWVAEGLLLPSVLGHRTVRFERSEVERFAASKSQVASRTRTKSRRRAS